MLDVTADKRDYPASYRQSLNSSLWAGTRCGLPLARKTRLV
jgi:hypothetical protein